MIITDTFTNEEKTKIKLSMICTLKDTQEAYDRSLNIGDSAEIKNLRRQMEITEKILEKMKKW